MSKRIFSLLLCACMLFSVIPAGIALDEDLAEELAVSEEVPAEIAEEAVIEEAAEEEIVEAAPEAVETEEAPAEKAEEQPEAVSASVGGVTAEVVADDLPEDVSLSMSAASAVAGNVAYDIKLTQNGEEYEPDSSVNVTISGIGVYAGGHVSVIHYIEDVDEIKSGKGILVYDSSVVSSHPASAAATLAATGENAVCIEYLSSADGSVSIFNGGVSFRASSFSIYEFNYQYGNYYVYKDDGVAKNSNGYSKTHEITMSRHDGNTYYVTRGQKVYLDIGPDFFVTGTTRYEWSRSENSIGNYDHNSSGILNGSNEIVVSSSAPLYHSYALTVKGVGGISGHVYNQKSINIVTVPEITIHYDANGTGLTMPGDKTTVYGDGTNVPYTFTSIEDLPSVANGYEVNWYDGSGNKVNSGAMLVLDHYDQKINDDQYKITIYAKKEPIKYNITYNLNGGTNNSANPSTYNIESPTITLQDPTREGYIFTGWSPSGSIPHGSTGDKTFTAAWREDSKPYVIHHKSSTGTKLADDTTGTVTTTGSVDVASNKKSFDGYNYTSSTPATITYSNTEATILYTPINYTITYSGLEGATVSGNPTSYNVETATFTLNNPTKTGYTFIGWTGSNGTSAQTVVSVEKGSTGNREYVANWQINSYDATSAIATGDAGVSTTSGSGTYDYNANVTFGATLKPGYDFIGWFNNAQGTGTALGTNTSYNFTMPDNAVTYYAKTTEQTVDYTYVAVCKDTVPTGTNFGSVSKNAETVGKVTGTPSATATANTPTFRFVGWFDNAAGTGTALSTELTYAPNNKDSNGLLQGGAFYAVFEYNEADYTVKHYQQNVDGNGYTEVTADKETIKGTVGQLTEAAAKTYPGFTARTFEQKTVLANGSTVVEIYYNRNPHKVTYVVEGDGPSADDEVDYLFGQTITDYAPTQTYYDFDGWYTDEDYTESWTKPATMPDADITVYGKFVRQTASLKLTKSGMEDGESAIFTITGEGIENGLRVVVPNGSSVKVDGLLVGAEYTITEDNGWNWQYTAQDAQTVTPTVKGTLYEKTFTNVKETPAPVWLSGEDEKKNVFGKASATQN